jgi:PAS domain S-box-containing protein
MTSKNNRPDDPADVRKRAEEIARVKAAPSPENLEAMSPEEVRQALHELRVHQIELEMQNEELRQAQAELDAARARYFDLYDMAPVGYCTLSEEGLILEANLMAATLLGGARGALVKQPITRFILPEDQDIYYHHRKQIIETGEPRACDLRMLRADAAPFWARLESNAAQDADGAPVCRVALSDITERKRAEEALRESEARHRRITESLADYQYTVRLENGRAVETTQGRACAAVTGYTAEEFAADSYLWFRMVAPEDRELVRSRVQQVLAGKEIPPIEHRILRKDGETRWVCDTTILRKDASGNLLSYDGVIKDITERKRAEEEKAKLEDQLRQAQKMESVGRLAGGVAHDFNNMLQVILMGADMALAEAGPDSPLGSNLLEIKKAGRRSADLTRQLLAFARKQIIAPRVLDLNDTVAGMLRMLGRLIGEDIDLLWKPGHDLQAVKMDPGQIDQILANLVVNARDAIAGVGKVTIETTKAEFDQAYCDTHPGFTPGQYVLLAVSDDGCGMDQETLANIFEPFFTTKESGEGTGLGLATVYGIVKQNNGFINVYSEPGKGTTLRIYLPPHEAEAAAGGEKRESLEPATGTETVLLVEDQEALLTLAKKLLERLGYTVLTANAPEKAIRLVEEHAGDIHLVITDVVMPEMSGGDLWRRLNALRPGMKCLFMSGYTANVIAHRGVLQEGVHFLQKPFSVEALAARVREALSE